MKQNETLLILMALYDAWKYQEDYGLCWGEDTPERAEAFKRAAEYAALRTKLLGKAFNVSLSRQ